VTALSAAHPYFGSKRAAAPLIWAALGANVGNFVDACCGSASVLWARPEPGKVETLNDAWGAIPNFLRALQAESDAVAEAASWPVSELDMHAWHDWLVEKMDEAFVEKLRRDPKFFDIEIAGRWVWGQSIWIGSGWCAPIHRNCGNRQRPLLSGGTTTKKRPELGGHAGGGRAGYPKDGVGIFRKLQIPSLCGSDGSGGGYGRGVFAHRKLPDLGGTGVGDGHPRTSRRGIFAAARTDLITYFRLLASRLARVRITCGDWRRVVTPAVTTSHGLTGILLDFPYGKAAKRTPNLYAKESGDVAERGRAWCAKRGADPLLRIVMCGYEGEHEDLERLGWRCLSWKSNGGYGNQDGENANAARERLWLSPHCLVGEREAPAQRTLFSLEAS
jgi:DNA adenine methylase